MNTHSYRWAIIWIMLAIIAWSAVIYAVRAEARMTVLLWTVETPIADFTPELRHALEWRCSQDGGYSSMVISHVAEVVWFYCHGEGGHQA